MRVQIARVRFDGPAEVRHCGGDPSLAECESAPLDQDSGPRRLLGQEGVQNLPGVREAPQVLPTTPQPEDHVVAFLSALVQPTVFMDSRFGLADVFVGFRLYQPGFHGAGPKLHRSSGVFQGVVPFLQLARNLRSPCQCPGVTRSLRQQIVETGH